MQDKPVLECTVCYPCKIILSQQQKVFEMVMLGRHTDTEGARKIQAVGLWNGYGGKFDPVKGDTTMEDCAVRETEEESRLHIEKKGLVRAGIIAFINPNAVIKCHFYFATEFTGKARNTREMRRHRWFWIRRLPYESMMDTDALFGLPLLLSGAIKRHQEIRGNIYLNENMRVVGHDTLNFIKMGEKPYALAF